MGTKVPGNGMSEERKFLVEKEQKVLVWKVCNSADLCGIFVVSHYCRYWDGWRSVGGDFLFTSVLVEELTATTAVSVCGRSSSCHVTFMITIMCMVKVTAADPNLISDPTNHSNPNPINPNGERHLRFYRSYYLQENYNNQVWSKWWRWQ